MPRSGGRYNRGGTYARGPDGGIVGASRGDPMQAGCLVSRSVAWYVTAMGHVYQRVKLAAVNEEDMSILVDTGATLSLIPPALADRLGIVRLPRKQTIILADGRRVEADVGTVMVEIADRRAATTAVIAECDEPLLGVETLETLGLAVDPTTGSLTPTRSFTVRLGGVAATAD